MDPGCGAADMNVRPIEVESFGRPPVPLAFGTPPTLDWLPIKKLVVDPQYQRDITEAGRRNILKIAAAFNWSMFATVVVAAVGAGRPGYYAIVDGQHRTTAAAAAFAAINAAVTAMSPLQLHVARLAAGDKRAKLLVQACEAGGVSICRYPIPLLKMKVGETTGVGSLYRVLDKYGAELLALGLRCITGTRNGNPGMVRPQLVEAICANLEAEPAWADNEKRLLKAIGKLDFAEAFSRARKKTEASRSGVVSELVDVIAEHLDSTLAKAS